MQMSQKFRAVNASETVLNQLGTDLTQKVLWDCYHQMLVAVDKLSL